MMGEILQEEHPFLENIDSFNSFYDENVQNAL